MEILLLVVGICVVVATAGCGYLISQIAREKHDEPTFSISGIQFRDLEGRMKGIELEWANAYDKLTRLTNRLTKERGLSENPRNTMMPAEQRTRASLLIRKDGDAR